MKDSILIGRREKIHKVPAEDWRNHLARARQHSQVRLSFMTVDHHRVRNFVVRELPCNQGKPLSAVEISQRLILPIARVTTILEELQKNLFFLVLNDAGEVSWAFPVTSDWTPHRLILSSGEDIFAAWAEDAIATPFVQGRLRNERLSVKIDSGCAHCAQKLNLTFDSELAWSVEESDADPLVFEPDIDWRHFKGANIIHDYWQNSLFFWSEEHAREYRLSRQQVNGVYLTLAQVAYSTRIAQSSLFGFEEETI